MIGFSWPGAAGADEAPTASEVTRRQCSPVFRAPLASFSAAMRNRPVLCFSGVELLTALSELRASSAGQVQANLDGPKDGMHTLRTTKMLLSPIESTAAQPPAGAAIPRSLDSALRDSVIRQFYLQARTWARPLRRGPDLQGSQNAEVSANCPLLQIPAHSRLYFTHI